MNIYHTAGDRTPYTYRVGWSKYGLYYYGVRYAKHCHPTEFWKSYFTSSIKGCHKMGDYGLHHMMGYLWPEEPDVVEIRKIFNSKEAAVKWEVGVLTRLNAVYNPNYINGTVSYQVNQPGNLPSPITRARWSKVRTGKRASPDTKAKMTATQKERHLKRKTQGLPHISMEARQKALEKQGKWYNILCPDGTDLLVLGLSTFCRDQNLRQPCMTRCFTGDLKTYKGYRVRSGDLFGTPWPSLKTWYNWFDPSLI